MEYSEASMQPTQLAQFNTTAILNVSCVYHIYGYLQGKFSVGKFWVTKLFF